MRLEDEAEREKVKSREKAFSHKNNFVCPEYAVSVLNSVTEDNCIVSTEVGQNQIWTARNIKIDTPRDFYHVGRTGNDGIRLAGGNRRVVCKKQKDGFRAGGRRQFDDVGCRACYNRGI
ncbi:MAG: hypothetical protein L6V93_19010 [Clostridiales bacterium]|nr:MAG: hypothetical protein L6V93_19010 [Clostridiales bacterium]